MAFHYHGWYTSVADEQDAVGPRGRGLWSIFQIHVAISFQQIYTS